MTTQLFKDPSILNLLEWPLIINKVKTYTHFEYTAENRIFCLKSPQEIEKIYNYTGLFIENIYSDDLKELGLEVNYLNKDEIFDTVIQRLKKDAIVELEDLNQVALLIEVYLNHFTTLNALELVSEDKETFHKRKRVYINSFLKEFRTFITKSGDIDFLKHPLLRKIYKEIVELEDSIRKRLSSLKSGDLSDVLQYEGHDLINDRYVIPIRTDSYRSSHGQIISRSDSGQTLFIEPTSLKDSNYKRLELVIELKKEISALTRKYSNSLKESIDHLDKISKMTFLFDHLNSISTFANTFDFVCPELTDNLGIELKESFHPLIESPVKNDVIIKEDDKGLIISGPNTGGKTATLKTVILAILFAKNGLYIPASSAKIHLYENLFYFGNDGQNLPDGLSSFAAEVLNYTDLFENLGDSNLIVIDEIFNSTSSEEASALAISLFNELITLGHNHLLVSTHHQMLKTYIHQDERFISAHVGFNIEENKPTYKLIYGLPGSSQALKIFSLLTDKNPINKAIFDNALKVLDKKMVSYEALLENVSRKELELDKSLKENKQLNHQLKNQKQAMEGVYKLKLDEKLQGVESKIKRLFDKAESALTRAKRNEISKKSIAKEESELKTNLRQLKGVSKVINKADKKYSHMQVPNKYTEGNDYFSIFLGQTVKLKSFNAKRKEAMVTKGIVTIKCPLDSLRLPGHAKQEKVEQVHITVDHNRSSKIEYDCRGMRLEEFQSIVEMAVSDLLTNKVPFINIIHGHGTGVLKSWVRKYVKNNPDICEDHNDTGNDGETKIVSS